jgi:tetratricopeptide (TPR) repeat protein
MASWILLLLWTAQVFDLPPVAQPMLADAKAQFFSRRFPAAEAILRQMIQSEPSSVSARYWLVRTLIENNQPRQALEEAELAEAECPGKALSHVAFGDACFRLADFDRALTAYQEAVTLNPKEPRAQLGLGRVLLSDFRFRSAKEHFQTALKLDPEDPDIALALSSVMTRSPQQLRLEEQYAEGATYRDPEELAGTRALISLFKLKGGKRPFVADNPPEALSVSLEGAPPRNLRPTAFVLRVFINGGEPQRLLIDTGAHGILISQKTAEAASIERLVPYRLAGLGDAGRLAASLGWADSVSIGGKLVLRGCPVIISEKSISRMWDGIIGPDVLRDFLITLDFPNNLLRIEKRPGSPAYDDFSWDRPAEGYPEMTPVRLIESKLLVKTEANGKGERYFVLDTGAGQTLIDRGLGEAVSKLRSSRRRVGGISGQVQEVLRSEEMLLRFAGIEYRGSLAAVDLRGLSYSLGVEIGGLVGCNILRDGGLSIDYRNGFIKIVKAPGPEN